MSFNADPTAAAAFKFERIDGVHVDVKARFLTRRQTMRHDAICEEIGGKAITDKEVWPLLKEAYELGIVSPTFDEIEASATERDIVHLVMNYPVAVQIAEAELGKSKSRRLIHAGESVATATPGDVPTPPLTEAR